MQKPCKSARKSPATNGKALNLVIWIAGNPIGEDFLSYFLNQAASN